MSVDVPFLNLTQTLMTVLDDHARMVEIVQMKWMISAVIVSLDIRGKTVQSVSKKYIYYWLLEAIPNSFFPLLYLLFVLLFLLFLLLLLLNGFYNTFLYLMFCVQLPKATIGSLY